MSARAPSLRSRWLNRSGPASKRLILSSMRSSTTTPPKASDRPPTYCDGWLKASSRGVPVVVKDVLWVAGRRITQGSNLFRDFKPPRDALCVERLRAAGAIILGIGNSSEFACKGHTTNLVYGPTRHPLNPTLTPGGSSGGSAAAVAADMAPLALGTDAGGSARRPPAHVGVVGFKPARGTLADVNGFPSVAADVDTIAPIARSVADVNALFGVTAGADPRDPCSSPLGPPDVRPSRALRIAFSPRFGHDAAIDKDRS